MWGRAAVSVLLAHGRQADLTVGESACSAKVRRIRAIRAAGMEPQVDVVRHGLSEYEAFLVEVALIDCLPGLLNAVGGRSVGMQRAPLWEYAVRYGAPELPADAPPAVLVRLGPWRDHPEELEPGVWRTGYGYRTDMPAQELVDSTRAWWRIDPLTVKRRKIRYAVAVHDGVTRAVMEIGAWTQRPDGRRAFQATQLTEGAVYDTWVGDLGRRLEFTTASQNPIIYWPRRPKRTARD